MPSGLRRFQQTRRSHFVTFSCYRRQRKFRTPDIYDLFVQTLEDMRGLFSICVYGYVVMPEHVHLLLSEPEQGTLADAIHYLKLSFAKRVRSGVSKVSAHKTDASLGRHRTLESGSFWEKRYYDRNVRDASEFSIKLRYLHRNPVKRGLVSDPAEWKWSSFRHYALREVGVVEIESELTARDRETEAQGGPPRKFLSAPGTETPATETPGYRAKNAREPGAPSTPHSVS
ncbi:MAG: transposase [Terriglobales bacterium]